MRFQFRARYAALLAVACALVALSVHAAPDKELNTPPKSATYVAIDLGGAIPESPPTTYFMNLPGTTLLDVLERMDKVKKDPKIDGVILRMHGGLGGFAKVQQLRRKLGECRDTGKKLIIYADVVSNADYLLASTGDRIVMPPSGLVDVVGLAADVMFYKGLLDKVGVEMDVIRVGEYKDAAEPFTRSSMSEAMRKSMTSLIDDLFEQLVKDIAESRRMSPERVKDLIDRGPMTAQAAKAVGMIDDVLYYDQLLEELEKKTMGSFSVKRSYGLPARKSMDLSNPLTLLGTLLNPPSSGRRRSGPRIALLYLVGPIVYGSSSGDDPLFPSQNIWSENTARMLRAIRKDKDYKALVVRIDSPGGSALASDVIWRELEMTRAKKPVIMSFSDVAASGGYWIGVGGDYIVAEPGTLTGSIGVVGGKLVLGGLFEKVGLTHDVIARGRNVKMNSPFEKFSESERKSLQDLQDEIYKQFICKVSANRHKSYEEIDAVAKGRVWTGRQALKLGLVDELGGLNRALALAKERAGVAPDAKIPVERFPRPKSVFEMALSGTEPDVRSARNSGYVAALRALAAHGLPVSSEEMLRVATYLKLVEIVQREHAAAILPYDIKIK